MDTHIIQEQMAYYRARAGEYDNWFYRLGRYDHGEALNAIWFNEVAGLVQTLHQVGPVRRALELACGTGIWTQELVKLAQEVVALDASTEVMEINRQKVASPRVQYQQANLFEWQPGAQFDLVFFSFWLSHVPPERLTDFLDKVYRATAPGGQIFLIDSLPDHTSSAVNHDPYDTGDIYHTRKLNDGREFKIIKVFYEPSDLREKLLAVGFNQAHIQTTERYFIYGGARKH
jgi:demethylmenaquinone methyltransferase/2-methoxy-6-polyprenyl-1,4-benzoquinol methylase